MKSKLIISFFIILFAVQNLFAQTKPQTINSKIEKVTLFTSGGQVMRKAKVTLPQGKSELVFAGISPNIDKQSIQVKGEGNFTILSVVHQTNYLNEQKRREETSLLENQKAITRQKLSFEKSMLGVFTNEENMLIKNQSIGGSNIGVKTVDLKEAVDFQRNRLTEVLLKKVEIEKNIQQLDSTIVKLDKQLKALNQTKNFATSEVLVTILSKEATSAVFELSYLVGNAGWFATYDLRVQDISKPIDLDFKANVFQNSGEDWKDVKLIISNGNPTESGIAPNLEAWYLRFGYQTSDYDKRQLGLVVKAGEITGKIVSKEDGTGLPGVTVLVKGTTIGTQTDVEGNYRLKLPENAKVLVFSFIGMETEEKYITSTKIDLAMTYSDEELSEVVVTAVGYGGDMGATDTYRMREKKEKTKLNSIPLETKPTYQATTMNFEIETPYTILNDGKIYTVAIKTQSVPTIYEYFAVPKLEKDAFLTAKIIDWQELNLLDGEVNLFFEGAFLGKSILDIQNADDTLNISLGRDKSIVVERKKLKEYSKKRFLSSNKTESRAYEITVRNNKKQAIQITVLDQFPISTTKEITVEEEEYTDAKLDNDTKQLTWKYELAAQKEKKHIFKYSVKYPKNQIVVVE
jgi:hypothetical protein